MDEIAEKMARALGLALLAVFGAIATVGAIWCGWMAWVWLMPMMFDDAPFWITQPRFWPFAAVVMFCGLAAYGLKR